MAINTNMLKPLATSSWQAKLELGYQHRETRTVLSHRKHVGPLIVQKPFYPEGEVCHTYLIHPPGGVVGGDRIELDINIGQQANSLVTTPAANKFYRSAGEVAVLQQTINVEKDATMEWLPQETILFSASEVNMKTSIYLEKQTRFIGWEMICLGRPASNDYYDDGHCLQQLEVYIDKQPRLLERVHLNSHPDFLTQQWGMANNTTSATMLIYPADKKLLQLVREHLEQTTSHVRLAATLLDDMLVIRGMAKEAEPLREALFELWRVTRPEVTGKASCIPRIWNT